MFIGIYVALSDTRISCVSYNRIFGIPERVVVPHGASKIVANSVRWQCLARNEYKESGPLLHR